MGHMHAPEKCFFTGLKTTNIESSNDSIEYFIELTYGKIYFNLDWDIDTSEVLKTNKWILRGLALNKIWFDKSKVVGNDDLKKLIETTTYPKTPKEKLENLFIELNNMQTVDGETVDLLNKIFEVEFWGKLYFKNFDECNFYINVLEEKGLIQTQKNHSGINLEFSITFEGLNYLLKITEEGNNSNNCFVAMSFGKEMSENRNAIKKAIEQTGFKPILIDEIHFDSHKTINDEIIASIKKSKFCISDFTEQKDGVYFEAGYALGRGLDVIYTCRKDWFEKTHFDTNHFPHIIYDSPEELTSNLVDKIEARIKN